MAAFFDRLLGYLKWPVALLALAALPGLALALRDTALLLAQRLPVPFLLGLFGYLLAWWLLLRRPLVGSWFSTLEHELTHALFALLTFHRVTGLRASFRSGGELRFLGAGNWLISIAPYFFPTFAAVIVLGGLFAPAGHAEALAAALGAATAYHLCSTVRETHRGQPDLAQVGFPFALCFLPSANALGYGLLFGFAAAGGAGAGRYLERAFSHSEEVFSLLRAAL